MLVTSKMSMKKMIWGSYTLHKYMYFYFVYPRFGAELADNLEMPKDADKNSLKESLLSLANGQGRGSLASRKLLESSCSTPATHANKHH